MSPARRLNFESLLAYPPPWLGVVREGETCGDLYTQERIEEKDSQRTIGKAGTWRVIAVSRSVSPWDRCLHDNVQNRESKEELCY